MPTSESTARRDCEGCDTTYLETDLKPVEGTDKWSDNPFAVVIRLLCRFCRESLHILPRADDHHGDDATVVTPADVHSDIDKRLAAAATEGTDHATSS